MRAAQPNKRHPAQPIPTTPHIRDTSRWVPVALQMSTLAGSRHLKGSGPVIILVQGLPLGLGDLPQLLGDDGDVVVRHILKEVLDSLLVVQRPQTLRGVKVGIAGEQNVVACRRRGSHREVMQQEPNVRHPQLKQGTNCVQSKLRLVSSRLIGCVMTQKSTRQQQRTHSFRQPPTAPLCIAPLSSHPPAGLLSVSETRPLESATFDSIFFQALTKPQCSPVDRSANEQDPCEQLVAQSQSQNAQLGYAAEAFRLQLHVPTVNEPSAASDTPP